MAAGSKRSKCGEEERDSPLIVDEDCGIYLLEQESHHSTCSYSNKVFNVLDDGQPNAMKLVI